MEVGSVIEYLQCIEDNPIANMYRGQLNCELSLTPTIARYAPHIEIGYDSITAIEQHLLDEFEKFVMPIRDFRDLPLIEKLIHAQHYGLPTRLLDWSTNPLKALYFAVDNPDFDNLDGVVWVFSPEGWYEGTKHVKDIDSIAAFYPELLNERINSQDGCFTAFPLPKDGFEVPALENLNYPDDIELLVDIIIPSDAKLKLRLELNQLGINHRTIYPGIDGVAKWVKSNLSGHIV